MTPTRTTVETERQTAQAAHTNQYDALRDQWSRAWPELDTQGLPIIARIMQLSREVHTFHEMCLEPHGIGHPEYTILSILRMQPTPYQLTPTELSRTLHQTTAGTSKTIDRLAGLGLVVRGPHPRDNRRTLVSLTPEGVRKADAVVQSESRARQLLLSYLSDDARVVSVLDELLHGFESVNENRTR